MCFFLCIRRLKILVEMNWQFLTFVMTWDRKNYEFIIFDYWSYQYGVKWVDFYILHHCVHNTVYSGFISHECLLYLLKSIVSTCLLFFLTVCIFIFNIVDLIMYARKQCMLIVPMHPYFVLFNVYYTCKSIPLPAFPLVYWDSHRLLSASSTFSTLSEVFSLYSDSSCKLDNF